MTRAKCRRCGQMWGISSQRQIDKVGYLCPECDRPRPRPLTKLEKAKMKVGEKG